MLWSLDALGRKDSGDQRDASLEVLDGLREPTSPVELRQIIALHS